MLRGWSRPHYAADSGTPGGTAADPSAETKTTDTDQHEHMIPKSRFDEVNRELADLRSWRQKREQAEAQAQRERQQAADEAAAQRGEFERLAGERQQRIAALETEHATAAERLTAYETEMERQIKTRLKGLPEEIKAMAPEGDALARFGWLEKAEAAAQKLVATRTPGTPSGPRGNGASSTGTTNADDLKAQKRARIGGL